MAERNTKQRKRKVNSLFLSIAVLIIIALGIYSVYQQNVVNSLSAKLDSIQVKYSTLKSQYTPLQSTFTDWQTEVQNPYTEELASDKTVTVPQINYSLPFYNSQYNLYNNYTISGDYFINFTAPFDGYLLLYLKSTSAQNGTYAFQVASNTSSTFFFKQPYFRTYELCSYYSPCAPAFLAAAGYQEIPNTTSALYVMPVLRGKATFEIMNSNPHPISVTFSLLYVGEHFANISINSNYT